MAPNVTNYAEIQNDEIEALRSIYMDDFVEHNTKLGAWNKVMDRSFSIKLRPHSGATSDVALNLTISLPNTYPKSTPKLDLSFDGGVGSSIRREAEELVSRKPRSLLGSEMIFEIATLLQDILDHGAHSTTSVALDKERAMQLEAVQQNTHDTVESTDKEEDADIEIRQEAANTAELQELTVTLEQSRLPGERRKAKWLDTLDENKDEQSDHLRFDRTMSTKDSKGSIYEFDTIHNLISFRQGPITKVSKVYTKSQQRDVEPHLLLKEARFHTAGKVKLVRGLMLDLEERLERLSTMKDDPNISKPLGYIITRSADNDDENNDEWYVGVLVGLAPKGSMQDLLETIAIVVPETFRAWALQLLEGLHFLHRNRIAHSSIHTSNILLEKAADTGNVVAKLADGHFQRAMHVLRANVSTTHHSATSSTNWAAPELTLGTSVEARLPTDIWDLGTCFSQMLFGLKVLNLYTSPRALIQTLELSPSLDELLDKLFRYDFKKRATTFDLLPAAFLRNEDPVLAQVSAPVLHSTGHENLSAVGEMARHRRESATKLASSRYRNDFVEAGRLGRGGFGEVVRSRNKLDGRFYAVKKIRSRSGSALNDVISEVMILSQINHPYVVRYYNAWLESDTAGQSNPIDISNSTEGASSSDSDDHRIVQAPSVLDFMSQSGLDVFEYDTDEETSFEKGYETSDQAADQNFRHASSDQLGGEDDHTDAMNNPQRKSITQTRISDSTLYIQMEYCERKTLRDLITGDIYLDNLEGWRIFRQILQGLAHIHALSIVHRDLKPENIFIDAENDVRIGDFGLARHGHYQPSTKPTDIGEAYTNFTKSIGTTFYVAPEVRSTGEGRYDEKADMYSLGIMFFEMCLPMMTGMERVEQLRNLREVQHTLPPTFNLPEKLTQGNIILILVEHDPSRRPTSSELLASEQIPGEVENDTWTRNALRHINETSYRKKLLAGLFPKPTQLDMDRSKSDGIPQAHQPEPSSLDSDDDKEFYPKLRPQELNYEKRGRSNTAEELLLRSLVKNNVSSIFRNHGAVAVEQPAIFPFSSHYLRNYDQVVKLLSSNDDFLQLPFDYTLPNARLLAKSATSPRKTYTFGDVYRQVESGGAPRRISEADFDIISYDSLDSALREAEVVKVVDEIINEFPSMASLPMCYYVNHSRISNAILAFCKIHPSKWALVRDSLGQLHGSQINWSKAKALLRAPGIGVAATSVEELMRFDFRDLPEKAIPKLRALLNNETLESIFTHVEDFTRYLKNYNVSRKVFISPLSSVNETFYRNHLFFQCIFDTPKKEIFAAGGRYDHLIETQIQGYQPRFAYRQPRAVGFSFNWERLCASMARYQKAFVKAKSRKKANFESFDFRLPSRCEVLVDSPDRKILQSNGLSVIEGLWYGFLLWHFNLHLSPNLESVFPKFQFKKEGCLSSSTNVEIEADLEILVRANDISAELVIDTEADEASSIYNLVSGEKESHGWIVYIKQDGNVRVRNVSKKEETEMRTSELVVWLRNEVRERDRLEGRASVARSAHPSQGFGPLAAELDIRIMTSATRGKKFNRKTVIEEAGTAIRDLVKGFGECPVVAIEIKDETFERIRGTRLSDAESWKSFIQNTPADDRAYLRNFQDSLQDIKERRGLRGAFIYNFRAKSCIYYDLG